MPIQATKLKLYLIGLILLIAVAVWQVPINPKSEINPILGESFINLQDAEDIAKYIYGVVSVNTVEIQYNESLGTKSYTVHGLNSYGNEINVYVDWKDAERHRMIGNIDDMSTENGCYWCHVY
ncbi:MAG: hypothetical protein KGZ63_00170 [Clostridiales bacterium]|jgi:uncharacterized protein YpmB|nr:hypothetical protein [Clostridiales bacterium]